MDHSPRSSDLLDHLAALAGGSYLSDLRLLPFRGALRRALEQTPAEAFPLSQWREAFRYLTDQDAEGDADTLRTLLFQQLLP